MPTKSGPPPFISTIRSAANTIKQNSTQNTTENKTITVPNGKIFEIRRPQNMTTGYQWTASVSSGLTIVDERYLYECPPGIVGCGGYIVWSVKTTTPGTHFFGAIYKRSWEPNPAETLNITVMVV
ncbi:hypothetical protein BH23THE1_BH23THE1_35560 [soil metagenome]